MNNRISQLKNKDKNPNFILNNKDREIYLKSVVSIAYYGNL